ncbi:hypothetical protein GCM10025868_20030 [Angustibacter aerolatus]|uniref:Uncharacterized protein n=1 Tax=Angustibacter aerolatus TaxID=1162965 RepID=A0ABQ6JEY9_9ACTN|nr:hypothetical protein GCM10025868_20030 [Angustibacter aerolatus]
MRSTGTTATAGGCPRRLDLSDDATEVDVYGGDFVLEPRAASGGLLASPASVARFIDRHDVYGLGGRMDGSTRYGTFVGSSAGATSGGRWDLAWATNREIDDTVKDQARDGVLGYLATSGTSLLSTPFDVDEGFAVRGVLLLGGFRTQHEPERHVVRGHAQHPDRRVVEPHQPGGAVLPGAGRHRAWPAPAGPWSSCGTPGSVTTRRCGR